jgi:probable phosphoglycerate mutase
MTDFVFIRHGETDWNRESRFQGQADPPLNAMGQAQATRLAQRLADERFDALISSDLLRARQTAAPLAELWRQPARLRSGLREQAFGALEGLDVPTIQRLHPQLWARWLEQRGDFSLPGGGESLRDFHARVLADVQRLAAEHPDGRLAVITHGGVLDMLWRTVHALPLDGLRQCDIPNTGINWLRLAADGLKILQWADAAHLAGLPPEPHTNPRR